MNINITAGLLPFLSYFRTGCTIFISIQNCIKSFTPGTTIVLGGEEHDLNDFVAMYENDLMNKYLTDQELMI